MKKIIILLLAAALILVTSGCTQSAPEAPPAPVITTTMTKAPSPTYLPATTIPPPEITVSVNDNTITIKKLSVSPPSITVKKGATVRWVNADSTEDPSLYNPMHRIKLGDVKTSPPLAPGQGWSWVFTDTGVYDFTDLIHTNLQGSVTVV
jgi:plastocyanin